MVTVFFWWNSLHWQFQNIFNFRTLTKEHIPKRHLDFENPINTKKQFDNTTNRIYGAIQDSATDPSSNVWGTGRNPANDILRVGRKTKLIEQEIEVHI